MGVDIHMRLKTTTTNCPGMGWQSPPLTIVLQERWGFVVARELKVTEQGEGHRSTASIPAEGGSVTREDGSCLLLPEATL